jgi:hypothetical protein
MLEKLTPEQEAVLPVYRDKWLNKIFAYELLNTQTVENIKKQMEALYTFCGFAIPEVIVVDSPFACQKVVKDRIKILREKGELPADFNESEALQFSTYINYSDFGWLSFYDFFLNETDIIDEYKDNLNSVIGFVNASFMSIQLDTLCVVSRYPSKIVRNENNDLHNLDGAAVEFLDGYCQYYYNGLALSEELFKSLYNKEYTFEQWTKESNEEIKAAVLAYFTDKFGSEYTYMFLKQHLKEVDTYKDIKSEEYLKNTVNSMELGVYTLFKGTVGDMELAYVRCYDYSSDRIFFLGVEPNIDNAKDAVASLCRVPAKLKPHLLSMSRQGEIFSFNFNEEGTNMLINKVLSEMDMNDLVPLTGDEYFSKMRFEY